MNVQLRTGVSTSLAWLFAIASGLSVANVYYAQPLLDALARDFGISHAAVGGVITATQLGCALALLFLVPLGDRVDRRRLMAMQMLALTFALVAVGMAQSTLALLAGMLAVGLLGTAMTQGLIAYAASAAAPHEQGQVVGTAQGGVFIGLLLARVFAGGVSDLAGWRGVYFLRCAPDAGDCDPAVATAAHLAAGLTHAQLSAPAGLHADVAASGESPAGQRNAGAVDVCRL
ncbi:major facilitator superfamily permease [Leclercia adecarboxylata ATCC 23216 = NBRC 102595]|nr:major facilitator superfamily permease [Leclercia adecarboxylata ATCC 23216 = NBRC 102595]